MSLKNRITNRNLPKKLFILLALLAIAHITFAAGTPEMADGLRTEGKIYVVVAVIATIFAGIIAYLIYIDRKLSRIEKQHSTK